MTAVEKMMQAKWKADGVAAQMLGAGFMAFAAASNDEARAKIFENRIKKYSNLFNALNSSFKLSVEVVEKVCEEYGEPEDIPFPWSEIWCASDEEVLKVLDDCHDAAMKEASDA